jgi:hypothetical protein
MSRSTRAAQFADLPLHRSGQRHGEGALQHVDGVPQLVPVFKQGEMQAQFALNVLLCAR